MYAIQNKYSKFYMGEINEQGTNSKVHAKIEDAKHFTTKKSANDHIANVIKNDAGITSKSNVVLVEV